MFEEEKLKRFNVLCCFKFRRYREVILKCRKNKQIN